MHTQAFSKNKYLKLKLGRYCEYCTSSCYINKAFCVIWSTTHTSTNAYICANYLRPSHNLSLYSRKKRLSACLDYPNSFHLTICNITMAPYVYHQTSLLTGLHRHICSGEREETCLHHVYVPVGAIQSARPTKLIVIKSCNIRNPVV